MEGFQINAYKLLLDNPWLFGYIAKYKTLIIGSGQADLK